MTTEEAIRPFANGIQFCTWTTANCDKCRRARGCEINTALTDAYCDDGTVSAEIARRMGYHPFGADWHYNWPCLEHDPPFENIEEWANA